MPKISALPAVADVSGNETVVMVKDGVTKRGPIGGLVDAAIGPFVAAAELARDQAADLVEPSNIFIDVPLIEAEAATSVGATFKLVDSASGLAEVRNRTIVGSTLLYQEATTSALGAAGGALLIGTKQAGAGAVVRSQAAKNAETVSITDFGAVGDGLADDTVAIQAALDASCDVLVPEGIFIITSPLKVSDFTRIHGVGDMSVIRTHLDIQMFENKSNIQIIAPIMENLVLDNAFPVTNVVHGVIAGTLTAGSPIVQVETTVGLTKAMWVEGIGIPVGSGIRHVSRSGNDDFHLCEMTYHANPVFATASGEQTLTLYYSKGQTHFHVRWHNSIRAQFYNVTFKSAFLDNHYSPENHAGIWLSRDPGASYFAASIESCYFNKGQICCGISDSNIKNTIVWSNPFDYSVSLEGPGCSIAGCNISAGLLAGVLTQATANEPQGGSNHLITTSNIDGGGIWYSGYGVQMEQPVNVTLSGNRINICQKSGIRMRDAVNCAVTGNGFLKNNEDDALFSDIEVVGAGFGSNRNVASGNSFLNVPRTFPGYAIKEVDGGAVPLANAYSGNSISAHYASPSILQLLPHTGVNDNNVGSVTNGITDFTPTWANVGVGNGNTSGWFKRRGSEITLYARLEFGSTTWVGGSIALGAPVPAARPALGSAAAYDSSTTNQHSSIARVAPAGFIFVYSDGLTPAFWNGANPFIWADGDVLEIQITFPV